MEERDYIIELERWIKSLKNNKVKDIVQKHIITCIIWHHQYCNIMQIELASWMDMELGDRIAKYGERFRECINNWIYNYNDLYSLLYKND